MTPAPFQLSAGATAVWQARRSLGRTVVAVVHNPFELFISREMFTPVPEGATLADLAPIQPGAWLCQVDDEYIGRAQWHHMPPPGAIVVFRQLPQGGGGGGKASLRVVALIAVSVLTAGVGGAILMSVAPGLMSAFTVGAANALFTGLAVGLVNSLIPLDSSNAANTSGGAQQFSAQAQGNLARIGQPVPEIFGYDNGWPDLAAQPYSLYEDNEQYLYLTLMIGRGQYKINRISVGDTSITSFAEATLVRAGPEQNTLAGPGTGVALLADQTLVNTLMVTSPDVSAIEMKTLDYVGPFAVCPPERTVTGIGVDILLPRGLDSGLTINWRVESRSINDFDEATSSWLIMANETYTTDSVTPVRLSYEYTAAVGRYQVRLVRLDTRSTSDGSAHDISWLSLRGVLHANSLVDADDCTFVCIKIKASGQLSGSLRFRAMTQRMLRTWDGAAWTAPEETRNPAWALARVLEARGVPDAQVDLAQLLTLAETWATRQDNFDMRIDSQTTTWDTLALMARVGRAVPLIRGGKYTFARDQQDDTPLALFGMRNIKRGSFALALAMPAADPMTTLDLEYWDHRRWGWVTVTAQIWGQAVYGYRGDANRPGTVGAPDPLSRGRIRMPGIIGENQAIRTAVYTLADSLYRRMVATFGVELDGLLPPPLGLVVLQHDVGDFGQGGDVADYDDGTLTVSTTEPLTWTAASAHYMRLMAPTGVLSPAIAVTQGATEYDAVLASAPSFTPLFDDAGRERTRYVFGSAVNMGALAKVRGIVPRGERDIEMRVVLEDGRVHTADNAWLPGSEEEQDPPSTGSPVDPDGGGDAIVNLVDSSLTYVLPGAYPEEYTPSYTFRVYNDGRLSLQSQSMAETFFESPDEYHSYMEPNQWLVPQTVAPAIAGLFEVRFSLYAGGGTTDVISGDALDTWHNLSTTRSVVLAGAGVVDSVTYGDLLIEIRDAATATLQDSARFTILTDPPLPTP